MAPRRRIPTPTASFGRISGVRRMVPLGLSMLRSTRSGWLLLCLSLGCVSVDAPSVTHAAQNRLSSAAGNRVALDREFKLRSGEAADIGDDGVVLRFARVTRDARCPVGDPCRHQGDATVVVIAAKPPQAPAALELHTDPEFVADAEYVGYRVRLVRLEPRPVGEQPVPLPQYWATFVVSKSTQ